MVLLIIVLVISIHTFRVEGDFNRTLSAFYPFEFQSTPSVWKVTPNKPSIPALSLPISIHTFRVEGDTYEMQKLIDIEKFQSTPSVWKVTL